MNNRTFSNLGMVTAIVALINLLVAFQTGSTHPVLSAVMWFLAGVMVTLTVIAIRMPS